ncbi:MULTISPECIES: SUF system Fe-S cluster assembly protein [Marichromatium]|uniref:FeS assembly SUF system protein n=1 Tax=Marichromatium gracile TaxID=1048 RepID=A0A4R4AB63_MARGR|nr:MULTISPECIES: SUF system Fe-S cluster assembly protein [Marichromatium]MBO8085854.1 SUF system Fe-S cluster assembly protein [Marichromatium sp.]MBK1709340.1 SUF system Fe-S cluster assembly protein [Marichromatium gracile]RNE88539.1 SUF system Fe-S cluster assembly protein [Marichromatium sp. AB31]RNE93207.1 SUF system Fe-S cluster assembly protein [Marichromatium sp. AB32]TCW36242.1 FeS assembly SUF system protein [Marichromatium gracile]
MNRLARLAGFGKREQDHEDEVAALAADAGRDATEVEDAPPAVVDAEALRESIVTALRGVHDPEIPVNIYDLGLIYTIDIAADGAVAVEMTLTAPGCPVAGMMPLMVKQAVARVEGVGEVDVALVWDPPWTQERMSDEARLQLGLM